MHKQHLEAVIVAAVDGERVLIVSRTQKESRVIMDELLEICCGLPDGLVRRAVRLNGGERIDLVTGGEVRFTSTSSRGGCRISVDRLFIPLSTPDALVEDYVLALAGSEVGLITGY